MILKQTLSNTKPGWLKSNLCSFAEAFKLLAIFVETKKLIKYLRNSYISSGK